MAGAKYVKHVRGSDLKTGDIVVFQDTYEVLGRRKGVETHTFRDNQKPTVVGVRFEVTAYEQNGAKIQEGTRRYNPGVEYPTGRLLG